MPKRKVTADSTRVRTSAPVSSEPLKLAENMVDGFAERHVVVGDLHLRRTDPMGIVEPDGLNTRLKDKLDALAFAVRFAVDNKATHFDLLGDAFEAVNPPEKLKQLFWKALYPIIQHGIQLTILIGNHDTTGEFYNFAGDTIIAPGHVKILKDAFCFHITGSDAKYQIMYLPYFKRDELVERMNKLIAGYGKPAVIFGHFEVEGAELAPDNTTIREGLDRTMFDGIPLVWSGHIHKFQEFRAGMAYIGSAVKCDFGEVTNRKVFGVLDIHLTSKGPKLEYQFVDIPQRPMYQINVMESDPDNMYLQDKMPDNLLKPGVLLKFILEGCKEWVDAIDKQRFKRRFPEATRVMFENKLWDTDRVKTELVTTNMDDRVYDIVKNKGKGKDFLDAGLMLSAQAKEIDL